MTTGLVGQHQLAPFASPQPGQPLDATVVLGNDNSTVNTYDAHDSDSTIHFQSSALADRPPASTLGQKWLTTDAGAQYIYYDNGSAWVEVDYFRDTGGTIVGDVTVTGNVSISGTLGVTGVATFTAAPILSSLTASKPVFTNSSKGLVSTGTLGTDQGGTNLTTYTTGDILYASATNVLSKLAIGTTGQHLIVSGGVPAWSTDSALGTVTSVSWTGGLVSVATATTTPAFTVAGTSGGIPYFSSASTWASSAALTQYGIVHGGGAGATPVATAAGTTGQVLTAVTSGAPVWSATYAGTVTSVGFTGGLISVATATTTPALTVAGTSGGVVYFSSASTWASSAALTASAIVLGGGAGAAPATTTTGTGVVTALGVNVGTAGAFVVNGGALGTPSSGAVAASLITAGTFGAGAYTFPGALAITGALTGVTSLTATSNVNVTKAGSDTAFSGPYLAVSNAGNSKTIGMQLDSTESKLKWFYYPGNALMATLDSGGSLTLAGTLAISGAFTGATTGTFSGAVNVSVAAGGGVVSTGNVGTLQFRAIGLSGENSAGIEFVPASASASSRSWAFSTYDEAVGDACLRISSSAGGSPIAGTAVINWNATRMSMRQNIVFGTDNTYDIGGTVSTLRPRDLFLGRNQTIGGTLGVTGAATFSSTVAAGTTTISTASNSQLYINSTNSAGAKEADIYFTNQGASKALIRSITGGDMFQFYCYESSVYGLKIANAGAITTPAVYSTAVGATNRAMYVDSTGLLGYLSSIRASKTNITPLTDTAWLDALTPVAFNYRKKDESGAYTDEANTPLEYGLIAEEVEGVNAELVFYDETEDGLALRGVSYNKLMIPLLQRVQALTARNDALTARVAALEGV